MFKVIDPGLQSTPDFLGPVGMRDYRQLVLMRLLYYRSHFVHLHLILVDELDAIHPGVCQLLSLGACVRNTVDSPPKVVGAWIRRMLQERARDVKGRAGN